jgi:hypothetical protein
MDLSRGHVGDHPLPELGDLERLDAVRAELAEIEALSRQVNDLTAVLRARLPAGEFRLVWALRDALECLATAELILRDRRGRLGDALPPDEVG